jgi:hypothetical protein
MRPMPTVDLGTGTGGGVTAHCVYGHRYTADNTYYRPDGRGRQCRQRRRRGPAEFCVWQARRHAYLDSLALRHLYRAHGRLPVTRATVGGEW